MPLSLENEHLYVRVHPEEGGRIASLRNKQSGLEFLLQPEACKPPRQKDVLASFQDGLCAGVDECLPSVGACDSSTDGGAVPDHGDFWQVDWVVEEVFGRAAVRMGAHGTSRPLSFVKQLSLHGHSLRVESCVTNVGVDPTSFLYACHPLFAVGDGDGIVLPAEVSSLRLHSSRNDRLGRAGEVIAWPRGPMPEELSLIGSPLAGIAEMLYTERLMHGCAGIYRTVFREGISVRFDTAYLPFLGLWLCYGGWPEDDACARQYAVALEPTTAPHGTLKQAQESGQAVLLDPGEAFRWTIDFEISVGHGDIEEFRAHCNQAH